MKNYIPTVYGVVDSTGHHSDVSSTERGAKNYATRHGYKKVSRRANGGYNPVVVAEKVNGIWKSV